MPKSRSPKRRTRRSKRRSRVPNTNEGERLTLKTHESSRFKKTDDSIVNEAVNDLRKQLKGVGWEVYSLHVRKK